MDLDPGNEMGDDYAGTESSNEMSDGYLGQEFSSVRSASRPLTWWQAALVVSVVVVVLAGLFVLLA